MSIIFPFDKALIAQNPDLYKYVESNFAEKFIAYILHSDYRNAVSIKPWLATQVSFPSQAVKDFADSILVGADDDATALNVLTAVHEKITYKTDEERWNMPEYWATADETLTTITVSNGVTYEPREGDCEDGAILAYVLCRLKGISSEKLMLFAGDVVGGGHCWLGYRPICYPLNWVFLDWCYWPTLIPVGSRNFYYIKDQQIYGESPIDGQPDDKYQSIWFGVNEDHSVLSMIYKATL